jgi:hypothetical protein
MDKLRQYLKSLSKEQKVAYALACGTTLGYLRRSISVNQRLDGRTCRLLDEHSGGFVKKQDLRPDIWPELVCDKSLNKITVGQPICTG